MNPSDAPASPVQTAIDIDLAADPFFDALDPQLRAMIVECATTIDIAAGERLLSVGDPADHFWLIRSGRVDIEIHGPTIGTLTIQRLNPGDILGVSWIAAPFRAEFDATAIEAGSAIQVDANCLRTKCAENAELGRELYRRFASLIRHRLHATRMQLVNVYEDS